MTKFFPSQPLEPRWKSYLIAACFVLPCLVLWCLSSVFFAPKLQEIWKAGGGTGSDAQWTMDLVVFLVRHGVVLLAGLVALVVVSELSGGRWTRYRKAALGAVVFIINTTVLSGIWFMCLAALIIAPQLIKPH